MITTTKKYVAGLSILVAVAFFVARIPTNTAEAEKNAPDPQILTTATNTVATSTAVKVVKPLKKKKLYIEVKVPSNLTPYTTRVLTDLLKCESGYNALALNAVDRDHTPSFGALQFKPDTWYSVLQKYYDPNITPEQAFLKIFDGDLQVKMFVLWFEDGAKGVKWWSSQFPDCAMKYNYWQ